jgi:molybdenum cofactor cytidylyltransferase
MIRSLAKRALVDALGLTAASGLMAAPGLVSIVGGGGKSSLLFALGEELPGRVVLTTTTRIFAAQMNLVTACSLDDPDWEARIADGGAAILVVGGIEGERAVGIPRELPARILARPDVDWVVVEADGSRMLPVKAPAEHEPVIPEKTSLLVIVVGIDALARPVGEIAHRPERVCELTGVGLDDHLTPETLAVLLGSSRGGRKGAPAGCRVAVLINKVESRDERRLAREIAQAVIREPAIERVLSGALRGSAQGWQVFTR